MDLDSVRDNATCSEQASSSKGHSSDPACMGKAAADEGGRKRTTKAKQACSQVRGRRDVRLLLLLLLLWLW
jgi:hypothetical protein